MHENIKNTVVLKESIKEFKTFKRPEGLGLQERLNFKSEISDWQSIYSDFQYGTHFCVYAKILGKKVKEGFSLEKVQLYLQNYTGSVAIGFNGFIEFDTLKIEQNDPETDERHPNRQKFHLTIGLQAFNAANITKSHTVSDEIIIQNWDVLTVEPIFTPALPSLTKIYDPNNMKNADYIDPLFMDRLGEDVIITPAGMSSLKKLHNMGLISDQNYSDLKINFNSEEIVANIHMQNTLQEKGYEYPCRPRNSYLSID